MNRTLTLLLASLLPLTVITNACKPQVVHEQGKTPSDTHMDGSPVDVPLKNDSAASDVAPGLEPNIEASSELPTPSNLIAPPNPMPVIMGDGRPGGGSQGASKEARTGNDDDDESAQCGNRLVENTEECDDGNTINDDACSNRCKIVQDDCSSYKFSQGRTYILCLDEVDWNSARSSCQSFGPFDLVTINNSEESALIPTIIDGDNTFWIGLNDQANEGTYVWASGAPENFTNWQPGEPNNSDNEDCVQIYSNSFWNDLPCNSVLKYLCEVTETFDT